MTDRSRRVLRLAMEEASLRGTECIEPEHLMMALAMTDGVAGYVLECLNAGPLALERAMAHARSDSPVDEGSRPWFAAAERCVARAHEELTPLGHNDVGTEHLILGVVLDDEGRIPEILLQLCLTASLIRKEVYSVLGHPV